MKHTPLKQSVIGALFFIAFSASAIAGIVKCTDENGQVTFTDQACKTDAETTGASPVPDPKSAYIKVRAEPAATRYSEAENARSAAWAIPRPQRLGFASDLSTLKAAKLSLASDDQARSLARQQAMIRSKL